jgi:hypothetical protein
VSNSPSLVMAACVCLFGGGALGTNGRTPLRSCGRLAGQQGGKGKGGLGTAEITPPGLAAAGGVGK